MGFEEEIAELEKQIAEAEKPEPEKEEEGDDEEPENPDAENDGDAEDEETDKDEGEKEPEKSPEEQLDASGYARLRRELAAERKARQELESRLSAPVQPVTQPVKNAPNPEPDVNKDPVAWVKWQKEEMEREVREIREWKQEQERRNEAINLEVAAAQEFKAIEAEFKASVPDFDDVADHFNNKMAQSIAMIEPHLTQEQVIAKVKDRVLRMAGEYVRQGLNPVEELYHLSKERYGYTPRVEKEDDDEPKKPDLSKVAANKKRNAGTAAAKGSGAMPQLTREAAAEMSVADWAALTPQEKQRLLSSQ